MIKYLPPTEPSYFDELYYFYADMTEKKPFSITFQVTENCCMACTYCYQNHKTFQAMTFETAKNIVDLLLNDQFELINTKNVFAIIVDFIGGEPLMEIALIDQICNYILKEMIKKQHPWLPFIRFSICSNGLLYFNPEVQNFFKKYNDFTSLTISLDGSKDLHDSCRLDLEGQGTYDRVLKAITHYRENFGLLQNTKMTFAPNNIYYVKDALTNLINNQYIFISCNCIFEKGWNYDHATIYYNQLKQVADYLIDSNLYNKVNIRIFNENDYQPMDENNNNNWCGGTDMQCISFDYQGKMYPCIRYMESSLNGKQKAINVGDINTGYLSTIEEQENFNLISNITRRSQSTDECFYCPIATGCSWCSAYNYEEFGTPNKRATYICCMHKAQSLANVYYWNKLYQKLNIDKKFTMYIPKEEALKIIDEKEYNYLLFLTEGDVQ